jgi:hypothetical protein
MPMSRPLAVLKPHRIRVLPPSYAWIDRRLRQHGLLTSLSTDELSLYVFLVLAADRDGLSCWRIDRMERELPADVGSLKTARSGLVKKDLIAFFPWSSRSINGTYQVLSIEHRMCVPAPRGGVSSLGDALSTYMR